MKTIAIIPARMNSSRFHGKPMAKIHGIPMIGHCYYRTRMCKDLLDTYVATCDREIYDFIESIGGNAIMTSDSHERASDRTAEAMLKVEAILKEKVDLVVMVQGDEPMISPEMVSSSIKPFSEDMSINVVNLMAKIDDIESFEDCNEIKVVVNKKNDAIYFSREPIPTRSKGFENIQMLKQVCIIPFTRDYLIKFNETPETDLEKIESIDMLRVIENGEKVHMVMTDTTTYSVDTNEDLIKVEKKMKNDQLMKLYING
jgi:3-deoxy-manno-octulosonate cytidylyltransferase (CMP-KDO synthetase)